VLQSIRDMLKARGILCFRRSVGRFQRHGAWTAFGEKGEADLECHIPLKGWDHKVILWVEVKKAHGGVQSEAQKRFERLVKAHHEYYIIATSCEDVQRWLEANT
jgi:hypothetical protein